MQFQEDYIYHIFNQGNNRQKIFFKRDNYIYFLGKIKEYIMPYADILAWCLMPNHFHLMVHVRAVEVAVSKGLASAGEREGFAFDREGFALSETLSDIAPGETRSQKTRTLNQSIGIMLRSYTNAINKQEKRSGSLFRKQTKAECVNCPNGLSPSFINTKSGTLLSAPHMEYQQVCFNYIHNNPVKAGLVNNQTDWEFSSAKDYAGLRNGLIIRKEITKKFIYL